MAIIRWEATRPARLPSRELSTFQRDLTRLFGTAFDSSTVAAHPARRAWVPAIDLVEEGDSYVVRADVPGVSEEDVKVEVQDGVLTISGERSSQTEDKQEGSYRLERTYGSFSRSLRLPEGVDADAIEARYDAGVLELSIPKPAAPQPHRVTIAVGGARASGVGSKHDAAIDAPAAPATDEAASG
jgi:HSP20 family protein